MKNLSKAVLAALVVASSFTACKKGDEDPGFTLKSRKGRLSQEWKVANYSSEITSMQTNSPTSNESTVTTTTYSGNTATLKQVSTTTTAGTVTITTLSATGTVTDHSFTFEKDGTWSSTEIVKYTSQTITEGGNTSTNSIDQTSTTNSSGIWYFTGKNKSTEDKKAENLILATTRSQVKTELRPTQSGGFSQTFDVTTTWANNENTAVWHLDRLAKDEIIAMAELNMTEAGTYSETQGNITTSGPVGPDSSKGTESYTLEVK